MFSRELTERIEKNIKWGKWVISLVIIIIFLNNQYMESQQIKQLVTDNKKLIEVTTIKIEFTQDMVMTGFIYDLKKQDEKLKDDIADLKSTDIERDIKRCSLVRQNQDLYTDEIETYCQRIKNIDIKKLKN
ncbi:hypothetical protein [Sebaldella sp. S0638]|uniref:hypothetical protein n=1 Tax=Sebaldella sp. S0638 TaxID=2957809 RepID=UPI0020A22BED|nr:hypothetical protein [Sebaldella sp. S0638]MCP1225676.1 hypothetical protein [Sebaldella sp. S0638]